MIPGNIFTSFANFHGIVSVNDCSVSSSAPRFFVSSSSFPEKFLFYMGMIISTELPSLVPLQRVDDCVEIHFLQWELCDPQFLNLSKFSALGTTVPARLLQEAPVIFVLKQISQFGSSGKCVYTPYAYPSPVLLLLATPLVIHEKKWKCVDGLGTLSSKLQKKTHPKTLSSKKTFVQKHFRPKTLSTQNTFVQTEDNFIHDTFIQKRVHPMTLSSKNGFVQWHFRPKPVSSNDSFIPNHFHPTLNT